MAPPAPLLIRPPLTLPSPPQGGRGFSVTRQRPSGARRRRQRGACRKALRLKARDNLLAQRCVIAEQMAATGDVEKQTVRRIEYDNRREALAPGGDVVERARVFVRFSFDGGQRRMNRARIGERHGEFQPQRRRTCVDAR